ncbi:MAG: thioredoxin family protein [Deltaproteobacteria bacterium]|jgi:thioredoxin 1|nr:thioredoxin family protein [Deltaproteobacteria bacterium]
MATLKLSSLEKFKTLVGHGITLVDFNAPWCAPCHAQEPVLDKIEKIFKGKATFTKINIDKNQKVAVQLGIQSIPTLVVYREGEEIARLIGLQDAPTLQRILADIVT